MEKELREQNDSSCERCKKFQPYCKLEGKNKDNCITKIINEGCMLSEKH